MIRFFAHQGVEHATTAEATTHAGNSEVPIILAVSSVIIVAIFVTARLLDWAARPAPTEKTPKRKVKS